MRQVQCVPTTYITENKETNLKYTLIKNHVHWLCLIKTSQSAYQYLNTCHYMSLHLHDSYITKFDFTNHAFAKLVVAGMYTPICTCDGWLKHKQQSYNLFEDWNFKLDWQDAKVRCGEFGGYLAVIDNHETNDFLLSHMT